MAPFRESEGLLQPHRLLGVLPERIEDWHRTAAESYLELGRQRNREKKKLPSAERVHGVLENMERPCAQGCLSQETKPGRKQTVPLNPVDHTQVQRRGP